LQMKICTEPDIFNRFESRSVAMCRGFASYPGEIPYVDRYPVPYLYCYWEICNKKIFVSKQGKVMRDCWLAPCEPTHKENFDNKDLDPKKRK
jgi:hypothetical protein